MFKEVTLAGEQACAGSSGLDALARFNFVFGGNGTGKTTISRIFATPDAFPDAECGAEGPTRALVYNRDYVQVTLRDADGLEGVFTLDDEDPKARAEYQALTGKGGTISVAEAAVATARDAVDKVAAEMRRHWEALRDAAWKKRSEMPTELAPMFDGF